MIPKAIHLFQAQNLASQFQNIIPFAGGREGEQCQKINRLACGFLETLGWTGWNGMLDYMDLWSDPAGLFLYSPKEEGSKYESRISFVPAPWNCPTATPLYCILMNASFPCCKPIQAYAQKFYCRIPSIYILILIVLGVFFSGWEKRAPRLTTHLLHCSTSNLPNSCPVQHLLCGAWLIKLGEWGFVSGDT